MSRWQSVRDLVNYSTKGITPKYVEKSTIMVLNQKCIRDNKIDYSLSRYTDDTKTIPENKLIKVGDILFNSTGQGTAGRCAFVDKLPKDIKVIVDSHILILRCNSYYEAQCLNYNLFFFEKTIQSFMDGSTGQGELDKVRLFNILVSMPKAENKQQEIASILSLLDKKIELNNKINQQLETMAKTLYDYCFVQFDFPDANGKPYKSSGGKMVYSEELKREIPEGWENDSLWSIADFFNGLAMQKHRPVDDNFLKVIKIKEMNEGFSSKSEFARADIAKEAIVENGDVLFSWSATLDVKLWSQGRGALNQHIFKVTSKKYPKTFYYFELLNYLEHFKMMAEKRKTTMGHITQEHLKQSRIVIPPIDLIEKLDVKIKPILKKQVVLEEENQKLAELRDWLLPMLMNGQVKVGDEAEEMEDLMVAEPTVGYGKSN